MDRDADRTHDGSLDRTRRSVRSPSASPRRISSPRDRCGSCSSPAIRTTARWGLVGSFWLSIDGERGGFFVSPQSLWRGSEMVRSFKSARARGWTDGDIYSYWQGQVGISGSFMIDPQQHADNLFQVARRVGAL